jgi:hypothetical protein
MRGRDVDRTSARSPSAKAWRATPSPLRVMVAPNSTKDLGCIQFASGAYRMWRRVGIRGHALAAFVGLLSASAPLSVQASGSGTAALPPGQWPPIEDAQFRSELLSILIRSAPQATSAPDLQDVTEKVLNASLAPYCNMPAELRKRIHALTISRPIPEYEREMAEALRRECNLHVFAREGADGKIFVVLYTRATSPSRSRIYSSRRAGYALAVAKSSAATPTELDVSRAALVASNALKRR